MKQFIIIIALVFMASYETAKAQYKGVEQKRNEISIINSEIKTCKTIINQNRRYIKELQEKQTLLKKDIDSLNSVIKILNDSLISSNTVLSKDIKKTKEIIDDSNKSLSSSIKDKTKYGLWCVGLLVLIGSFASWLLSRKMKNNNSAIENEIHTPSEPIKFVRTAAIVVYLC